MHRCRWKIVIIYFSVLLLNFPVPFGRVAETKVQWNSSLLPQIRLSPPSSLPPPSIPPSFPLSLPVYALKLVAIQWCRWVTWMCNVYAANCIGSAIFVSNQQRQMPNSDQMKIAIKFLHKKPINFISYGFMRSNKAYFIESTYLSTYRIYVGYWVWGRLHNFRNFDSEVHHFSLDYIFNWIDSWTPTQSSRNTCSTAQHAATKRCHPNAYPKRKYFREFCHWNGTPAVVICVMKINWLQRHYFGAYVCDGGREPSHIQTQASGKMNECIWENENSYVFLIHRMWK